ncbi:lactate/malate family dehydrogenase [Tundrisphaera sp. TA3]|uniref:lactate/malate family dehydrogenase n=1 Tax=Tundrisphaera sp. TA3 TaxID=3435775 RepID=UPI003EC0F2C5
MKISVVGMGHVGGALAFALVLRAVPHELVVVGRTRDKVLGDANDLMHAAALVRPMRVRAGELADTAGSDIIFLAASAAKDAHGDRLDAAEVNARLFRELVPPLAQASPEAVIVVLSNPVDICTYVALKASGFPPGRVLGTGTLIDTARFRSLLSREIGINAIDIRAYILGEHGETQFPALSVASAGGMRLRTEDVDARALADKARGGGHQVAREKGYTNYAVALSATLIGQAIAEDARTVLPVSTLVDGFLGVKDVCLSLPCVIGRRGVDRILPVTLDADEVERFRASASVLRKVLDEIGEPPSAPQA